MPLTHAALHYILARPEVSIVIPGPKSVEQAHDNFAAAGKQLPAETARAIYAFWERELKDNPLPW